MRVTSTRNPSLAASFREAVLGNLPGDGGLYAPADLAPWPDVAALLDLPWEARNAEILRRLLGDEFDASALGAFDFPAPLVEVAPGLHALELFHGPSLAFKDFGARFLARTLERFADKVDGLGPATAWGSKGGHREQSEQAVPPFVAKTPRLVLTATSGDTGAAVAAAFHGRPGVRVAVLYPAGRVSPLQERQLACLGGNVRAFAVAGSFDDCQALVKGCFADGALSRELGLTSANSINLARLLAQTLYYFEAVSRVPGRNPVIAVPSGNFGNLCAGLYARALGLPVRAFAAATNANRTVPDHLDGGPYAPRPSVATLSNAMDVGDPSNWERIAQLHGRDPEALRRALRWGVLDDAETAAALAELRGLGYQADPHGAVAYGVLKGVLRPGEVGVFLETAHPAKFQEALAALGFEVPLPESLRALMDREVHAEPLAADLEALKARLRA